MARHDRFDEPERDRELAEELRRLKVPEHHSSFFPRLESAMAEEEAEGSTGGLRTGAGRDSGPGRGRRRWLWAILPVAAVLAAVIFFLTSTADVDGPLGPQVASAAEIAQKVEAALERASALQGTLVVREGESSGEGTEMRWSFLSTARGDFRFTGMDRQEDLSYDAETGVQRTVSIEEGGPAFASERTGLAPGLPDPGPADFVLERRMGSVVRALSAAGAGEVKEIDYQGRPAWTVGLDVVPNALSDRAPDHLEITVDQDTGFPVRVVEKRDGRLTEEIRVEDLQIDPDIPAGSFRLEFPAGVEVTRTDEGFERVSLKEAAGLAGYAPLLPAEVPEGFVLKEVAVSQEGHSTGVEAMNPAVGPVVSVLYRRGFDRMIVSLRPVGPDPAAWSDPLATGEGHVDTPEPVELAAGALAGITAEVLLNPQGTPHAWALGDELVVTVSGDLSRDEIVAAMESLQAQGG